MIAIILLLPFFFATWIQFLHLPGAIKYVCDAAYLFLLLLLFIQKRRKSSGWIRMKNVILLYMIYTCLVYLIRWQNPAYYLWGARNTFRFYIAFLTFAYFASTEDITQWLQIFDKLFWVNAAICAVQYIFFDKQQDFLGGIFGVEKGCNAYMNIFFVIIVTKSLLFYLAGKESLWRCILKCGMAMILAALAELKVFFVELLIIGVSIILITAFSWRRFLIILGLLLGGSVCIGLLGKIFPGFSDYFSIDAMIAITANASGYTGKGDLNRLTTIPICSERFLTTPAARMFGMGLGNCETASYSIFTTPFYSMYSHLHYTWFSTAFVFLETGYVGLTFFFGFFVYVFFFARRQLKNEHNVDKQICCQMAMIIALCAVMIGVYNSSLRTEAGYMMYFILSFPFIVEKENFQCNIAMNQNIQEKVEIKNEV